MKCDFSKYNTELFKQELSNINWNRELSGGNFNSLWSKFKDLLIHTVDAHVPPKEKFARGRTCPWLNKEIKDRMHTRDYYLKCARRTNAEVDWSMYRRLRNSVTTAIKLSKAKYCRNLLRNNIDTPKGFWKSIKSLFPVKNKSSKPTIMDINRERTKDKAKIANGFCSFFSTVGSKLHKQVVSIYNVTWKLFLNKKLEDNINPYKRIFKFTAVSKTAIEKVLKSLKVSKSSGPDNITASMLTDASAEIAVPLGILANLSFQSGIFPTTEKCAKVTPIYKSDDRCSCDNYRPI